MELSLDIEPLCQSLFMTMVGVSLLYSFNHQSPDRWNGVTVLRRAGELYAIGWSFHRSIGIQWPWMFIGHRIIVHIFSDCPVCATGSSGSRLPTFVGLWTTLLV